MPFNSSGLRSLGVNAVNPPDTWFSNVDPTDNDYIMHDVGKLCYVDYGTTPETWSVWYLASKANMIAKWIKLYPQTVSGGGGDLRSEDLNISVATPLGYINVYGAEGEDWNFALPDNNITTYQIDANTLGIGLTKTINQPLTNATATQGMYKLGGTDFLHVFGVDALGNNCENTWCGLGAGNLTLNPDQAKYNSAFGFVSLGAIGIGQSNTACGSGVLSQISDGSFNCGLGALAGDNYLGPESSNIVIANPGVAGDTGCIRIGVMGVGPGEQSQAFLAGIWNSPAVPVANTGVVIVDNNGQLYVDDVAANSVLFTDAGGNLVGLKGDVKTILTGRGLGAGDPAPEFLEPYSPDLSVIIGVDGVTGQLTFMAAPAGGGVSTLTTDDAIAVVPDAGHNINIAGDEMINTVGIVANTVTINLDRSTLAPAAHCEIVTGMGPAAASIYKELFCSDGSILFDLTTDPTKIDITAPGGGGGALATLSDDVGTVCIPVLANIQLDSGDNIETTTLAPGVMEIRVTDNVDLPFGWLHTQQEIRTTASDLVADAGCLRLPATNAGATAGAIYLNSVAGVGGNRFLHGYGSNNVFVGNRSGNTTLTIASSYANVGIGLAALEALDVGAQYNCAYGFTSQSLNQSGSYNSSYGQGSLPKLTGGTYNSAFSAGSLSNLLTGNRNFAAGYNAGSALVGSESDNVYLQNVGVVSENHVMRLGTNGSGNGQVSACYIAAIWSKIPGPSAQMVTIGSDGKLGTTGIPGGGASIFVTDAGTATPSGVTLNIFGRYNIDTYAALGSNTIQIDVTHDIQQDDDSFYSIGGRGAPNPQNSRFMHAWGTDCAYLGLGAGGIVGGKGVNCTGVGAGALTIINGASNLVAVGRHSMVAATSAKNTVCVGSGSGSAITTAQGNLLIGVNAGLNYDTESYNIIVGGSGGSTAGDAGAPFDSRTMYLGYKQIINPTTGAITTHGTDNTYVYGVYGSALASSATPVYVDHFGKLGTAGSVAFSFHLINTLYDETGDGTLYNFGQTTGSIGILFDKTSSLSLGGAGIPTVLTIPFDGRYHFSATVTYLIPLIVPPPPVVISSPLYLIITPLNPADPVQSVMFAAYLPDPIIGADQYVSEVVSTFVELKTGDTVQWACRVSGGTKQIGLVAFQTTVGTGKCWATHFEGYRVS